MTDEISQLQARATELAEALSNPDISSEEYSQLSTEYTQVKRKISSLKIKRFMEGV